MPRRNDRKDGAADTAAKRAASAYATGGGGVALEHAYGAVLLAALLRQTPVNGLGAEVMPVEVRFQQGASHPVDDVVVVGSCPTGERRMFVGVRRNPTIGPSSASFVGLLADYVRMVVDHRAEFDADRWRLALAVAAPHTASADVATLAWHARKHRSHVQFRAALNAPQATRARLRARLRTFDAAVDAAARHVGVDGDREELTWDLLRALRLIHLALEGDDPADRSRTVGELTSLVGGVAQATDLWRHLLELSAGYAQAAATVDRDLLRRDLSARFDLNLDQPISVGNVQQTTAAVRAAVRVSEADPRRLGVHASIQVEGVESDLPSYVQRDVDGGKRGVRALLTKAADHGGFVLLVGGSSVGKTRCAYEAVQAVLPDWWLIHPSSPDDIAALSANPPQRTVLWLDEMQRYFGGERGLTSGTVRHLLTAASPVVIVGTLWPDRYLRYTETPAYDGADLHGHEREVVELADVLVVPETFSVAEQSRAKAVAATDRLLATALDSVGYGLTQTLAAAPQLVSHWEIAKTVHPYAWAVLLAAADITMLGAEHPLPETLLRSAAPGYCTDRQRAEAPVDWFERGIAYATQKLHGATAALGAVGGPGMGQLLGFEIADYLLQHVGRVRAAEPIPASAWEAVLHHLTDPDDLVQVAESASARLLCRYAVPLYRRAADAGVRAAADQWAILTGDPVGVADLRARATNHDTSTRIGDDAAEDAAKSLGQALIRLGELDELRAQFRPTADRWGPSRRTNQALAQVLADRGAADELRTLADRGDLAAAEQLADFLAMRGDAGELRERAQFETSVVLPASDTDRFRSRYDKPEQTAARERLADYLARRGDVSALAARTDAAATRRLFTLLRHRGDVAGMRRLADLRGGDIEKDLVQVLAHRGDLQELLSLAECADEMLLDRISMVFLHRGALRELDALTKYHWPAADRLAAALADQGETARLTQLATDHVWGAGQLVDVLTCQRDVAALRDFESKQSGFDAQLVNQALNTLFVHRGDLDELAARARQGVSDAARQLAHVLGDRGDADGAWRVLREAGQDRHWRVASIHDELVVDLEELRSRADEGDGVAAARLASALIRRGDIDQLWARANLGDDSAASKLAEAFVNRDEIDELRILADAGHHRAAEKLAEVLVCRGRIDELTIRADRGDERATERLLNFLVHRGDLEALQRRANAGDLGAVTRWNEMTADRADLDVLRELVDSYSDRLRARTSNYYIAAGKLVDILVDRGEVDELRVRADNHNTQAACRLAALLADRGELEELRVRANAGDSAAEVTLADVLADRRAMTELRARVRERPDDFQAPERLVRLLVAQGELAEAHRILLTQTQRGDHRAARWLPELLVWLGRHEEARQVARYGLDTDGFPATSTEELSR
ncbi:hypothetical protein OG439_24460 [Amycolatopsis sp. NBC_01307]|uniref:hypothetical protein n=1 Tax=Amycolatopsis sp. NBC_01307 TaxID=2903561 RepID=UPI002E161168|nr:hypothetical protein OG439_24460 [Amycolatopsis sp. NBC_01307]